MHVVDDEVVHYRSARAGFVHGAFLKGFVFGQHVRDQGTFLGVDVGDCVFQFVVGNERQQGTKDFLAGNAARRVRVQIKGRRKEPLGNICGLRLPHLSAGTNSIFVPGLQSSPVALVDDAGIVRIVHEPVSVEVLQCVRKGMHQIAHLLARNQHVVWSYADLPGVHAFGPSQQFCRPFHGEGGVQKNRRFSAQLQGNGSQVLAGRGHDGFANGRSSGKENVVPGVLQKRLGGFGIPLYGAHPTLWERLVQHFGQQLCRGGCHLAGFEHHRVARGNSIDHRAQTQINRKIPRSHHQHGSLGFVPNFRFCGPQGQGAGNALGAHPSGQFAGNVVHQTGDGVEFAQIGFNFRPAQVRSQGTVKIFAVGQYGFFQSGQGCPTLRNGGCARLRCKSYRTAE